MILQTNDPYYRILKIVGCNLSHLINRWLQLIASYNIPGMWVPVEVRQMLTYTTHALI